MKKMILTAVLMLSLAGCDSNGDNASSTMGAGWVTLPGSRGIVMCASASGYGISCDWDHAERTPKP